MNAAVPRWGVTTPDLDGFRELAASHRVVPVARRLLADDVTPVGLYRRLAAGRAGTFILESAEHGAWSRWSFVGVRSQATLLARDGQAQWLGTVPAGIPAQGAVLDVLRTTLRELHTPALPGLPPLTGGLVGALGWDVLRQWEPRLRASTPVEIDAPEVALCLAADLAAIDHTDGSVWLIANAVNTDGTDDRVDEAYADAVRRIDAMAARLREPSPGSAMVTLADPAPEVRVRMRTSREDFERAVMAAKSAITDGEVFQLVLSQRLDADCPASPLDVYRALRTINPSPYMYYLQLPDVPASAGATARHAAGPDASGPDVARPDAAGPGAASGGEEPTFAIVGSSPETLVKVEDGSVVTYPIAGSRPRGATPAEDRQLAEELLADPKERAEHLMLVDLARNDLVKVCRPASVTVVEYMAVKHFSHIMHLSSTVSGDLREGATALDCLTAVFPAGTLSGAPKPRAIELIDDLEPARRGVYGGTVGYIDFAGNADMAIAIRTAFIRDGVASVQAGAGIVADSVPSREWQETRDKAAAALAAVRLAAGFTLAGPS